MHSPLPESDHYSHINFVISSDRHHIIVLIGCCHFKYKVLYTVYRPLFTKSEHWTISRSNVHIGKCDEKEYEIEMAESMPKSA